MLPNHSPPQIVLLFLRCGMLYQQGKRKAAHALSRMRRGFGTASTLLSPVPKALAIDYQSGLSVSSPLVDANRPDSPSPVRFNPK
jgi:hypothetical protein